MASLVVSHPIFLRPVGRRWQNGAFFFGWEEKRHVPNEGFPTCVFFRLGFCVTFLILFKMALLKGDFEFQGFQDVFCLRDVIYKFLG